MVLIENIDIEEIWFFFGVLGLKLVLGVFCCGKKKMKRLLGILYLRMNERDVRKMR